MPKIALRLGCLVLAVAGLALCPGCAEPTLTAPSPTMLPAAVAAQKAKQPTLFRAEGSLWVVGLPAGHEWTSGRRLLFTKHDNPKNLDVKVGVLAVVDDDYPNNTTVVREQATALRAPLTSPPSPPSSSSP